MIDKVFVCDRCSAEIRSGGTIVKPLGWQTFQAQMESSAGFDPKQTVEGLLCSDCDSAVRRAFSSLMDAPKPRAAQ